MDLNVNFYYCFWRSTVGTVAPQAALDPSSSPAVLHPRVSFYKITGEPGRARGQEFQPVHSAINTPPPYWWMDTAASGLPYLAFFMFGQLL